MEFTERKQNILKYAKHFCFSQNHRVFLTGKCAHIYDRSLNLLHSIENLSYTYDAVISPDDNNLLIISTTNLFYIVNLNDFSLIKQRLRGRYSDNLEGRGCWSFDGNFIYLPVTSKTTLNSALRRYSINDGMSYEDFFEEKYWIVDIKPIKELNKYLMIGLDRKKAECNRSDNWNMLWYDGNTLEEYPILSKESRANCIYSAQYEAATDSVILYTGENALRCDTHGNIIGNMQHPDPTKETVNFSDVFTNLLLSDKDFNDLKNICESLGLENVSVDDSINKICLSLDKRIYYIGTRTALYAIDTQRKKLLAKKIITNGVHDIVEISPKTVIVSCGNLKIFELT